MKCFFLLITLASTISLSAATIPSSRSRASGQSEFARAYEKLLRSRREPLNKYYKKGSKNYDKEKRIRACRNQRGLSGSIARLLLKNGIDTCTPIRLIP